MEKEENNKKIWAKIVAKASADENFKQELFKHPERVLKDYGIEIPKDHHIHIHENTENKTNIIIKNKKMSTNELNSLNAASGVPFFSFI